jgi:BirA family biotin operon repressor/biotin-[acetyl-CoA-carboxylase] ligase
MSVYVTPNVPLHAAPRITLAAGVAIAEFLTETAGIEATLKWPNDIMVHGRKLGGILVESTTCQGSLCAAIGIGLNVNVAQEEIPTEVRASATSLQTEAGRRFDRLGLLTGIVEALREAIATLETNRGELGELRARWEARSGVAGKAVVVNGRHATVRCLARGGGLEVEWSDGSTGTVESGLIQW